MKKRIPKNLDRNNFAWKIREIKAGKLIPAIKICDWCHHRPVKHHHFLCDICYSKKYNGERK